MEKYCLNCGAQINPKKRADSLFCKTTCRSSYHQKQHRVIERKPVYRLLNYFNSTFPKLAIWGLVLIGIVAVFPWSVKKTMGIYREHQIEQLLKLEKDYEELERKQEKSIEVISEILNPKNGWISKEDAAKFKENNKGVLEYIAK